MANAGRMSLKRKFVQAGVFKAEVDEFLRRELAEDGYSGVRVRSNERRTEIIISATRVQSVLGDQTRRIRELISLIKKRTRSNKNIEVFLEKMMARSLSATTQAESLRYKLTGGLPVRKVKIMLNYDPSGATGPKKPLPDSVTIQDVKDEVLPTGPLSIEKSQ
ncbi:40S ribosomal protein S3 [Sparganum proliferum]